MPSGTIREQLDPLLIWINHLSCSGQARRVVLQEQFVVRDGLSTLKSVPTAMAVAFFFAALLFFANYESLGRGGGYRIDEAFRSGALQPKNYLPGDAVRGYHQYNDCLIVGMAVNQQEPRWRLAVSPTVPANDANMCEALQKAEPRIFYHNYLHGQVTLIRYLLPVMSIARIRNLYRLAISLLLGCAIALAMLRLVRRELIERNGVALIVFICFARAFGLETFGQSLGHAPADFILIAFTSYFALAKGLTVRRATVAAASFGSLTMIFELLTGGLPLGIAVTFGLLSLRSARMAISGAAAFCIAAVTTYGVKLAVVAFVFGDLSFLREIGRRTIGGVPSDSNAQSLLSSVLGNTEAMMPGLGPLAGLLLLAAIAAGLSVLVEHPSSMRVKLLALSNLPIFIWPLVFRQHMIVHGGFMDRIFVWPIASGFAMFFMAALSGPERHQEPKLLGGDTLSEVRDGFLPPQ